MKHWKSTIVLWFLLLSSFFLSGCDSILWFIWQKVCDLAPDTDHCFQWSAVQAGSPEWCDKIKWTKFKDVWSNPPRDKCYMTIAMNKWDYSVCNRIKWWMMSYTKEECISQTAIKKDDPTGCAKLQQWTSDFEACRSSLITVQKLESRDKQIDDLLEKLKSDYNNKELKKELEALKASKKANYDLLPEWEKTQYFQKVREGIMWDVEDEDVKSAISKEFIGYRSWESDINKLTDKLEQITEKQKSLKKLDEEANVLVDQVKEQLEWIVNDKQDEIIGELWSNAKEWLEKNWWNNMKWTLKNYEYLMEKYEKWSKLYEDAKWKYDKIKWVYDEAMELYWRVDQVNKLLAEWKIDEWKAKVLKWAVLLDKWLEYATEYVPVFGSTISKVSKATFGTVIELAKKRAQRSTALDKCFEDPANCDTDSISWY